jgi:hypothetical protein
MWTYTKAEAELFAVRPRSIAARLAAITGVSRAGAVAEARSGFGVSE